MEAGNTSLHDITDVPPPSSFNAMCRHILMGDGDDGDDESRQREIARGAGLVDLCWDIDVLEDIPAVILSPTQIVSGDLVVDPLPGRSINYEVGETSIGAEPMSRGEKRKLRARALGFLPRRRH